MNRCETMAISMELAVPVSFCAASRITTFTYSSSRGFIFGSGKLYGRWKYISKPIRFCLSWEKDSTLNRYSDGESAVDCGEFGGDSEFVEVIGIGSRKDAVLDFCLDSSFHSSSLRFWNILMKDTMKVQLQQRFIGKDFSPRILEAPLSLQSCSKAIILVVSAGYGLDHITAIEIIRTIRSLQGFAIAIVLKPFSFEGQRRQNEVRDLVEKLQEHTNFCIDIDTDTLLREDLVTLDEALKTANNAVLFAINAITVLVSDAHRKFIDVPHNNMKELKFPELIKILESYKEAKIGFGAGYNIKTSIAQAIYDCPFLSVGVKDLNGIVICILASSGDIDNGDVLAFLHAFRQTTEYMKEIIISIIHEPNLESNLLVTTVIILGSCSGQPPSQKRSIFSRLTQHFPFVFNLLWRHYWQSEESQGNHSVENPRLSKVANSLDSIEAQNRILVDHVDEGIDMYSEELQTVLSSNRDEIYALRHYDGVYEQCEFGFSDAESSNFCDSNSEGTPAFQREPLISWNLGPGYQIAQEWAKERADNSGPTSMHDNLSIFHLPVGVRPSEELKDSPNISNIAQHSEPKIKDDFKTQPLVTPSMSSWDALTDAGFEAVMDLYSSASTLLKGKYADAPKKQGVLSVRAASMLEAERDTTKKWSPIVEMQYRGGVYRGRSQGGLPEGKGCLTLGDASIYDGMWRYGKRSGLGTFYFSNGDVFQGSWRDDVMHGKGWFYFHTGDRWFANFWKGKANGEGRFYSKFGDIFFGHFRDGWRHGHFLCINVDGERFVEIWDDGVLVSCEQLDCDTGAG